MSTYDPTPEELASARRHLSRVDTEDLIFTAFAQIAGRLDGIGTDVEKDIREMRAVLAAYDERRGGTA